MVRSKFPGKPSKIVNRKIVNSSKYSMQQDNESTKAAENISYGLAVFNEAFGDHDQVLTAFHGFSPHEVEKAKIAAKKLQANVAQEYKANGMTQIPEKAIAVSLEPPSPETLILFESCFDSPGLVGRHSTRAHRPKVSADHLSSEFSKPISPSKFFSPLKGSVNKKVANRLLRRAKKSSSDMSSSSRISLNGVQIDKCVPAAATGVIRKFVLPSRSVHSSRVIKPNKRFLDSDENAKEASSAPLPPPSSHPQRSRTIELKKPRLILDEGDFLSVKSDSGRSCVSDRSDNSFGVFNCRSGLGSAVSGSSGSKEKWKHVKLGDLNVFGAPTSLPKHRGLRSGSCGDADSEEVLFPPNSGMAAIVSKHSESVEPPSCTGQKVILREAKLNINSPADKLQEGLFSKKSKKSVGFSSKSLKSPGTPMECGVCGTVRVYRFVKLAHKFGINSCDPCRKFIAKMIIKAHSSENTIECEKDQGNCVVSSLRMGEVVAKGNRCWACWLLMCLQRYVKMPEQTRESLRQMLPLYMQSSASTVTSPLRQLPARSRRARSANVTQQEEAAVTLLNYDRLSSVTSQAQSVSPVSRRVSQPPLGRGKRKAAMVSLANTMRKAREKSTTSGNAQPPLKKKAAREEGQERPKKIKKVKYARNCDAVPRVLEKVGRKNENKNMEKGKDGVLRQKLSLKGPRVKHVCRSASIVLGQPLATFPSKSPSPIKNSTTDSSGLLSTINIGSGSCKLESISLSETQEVKIKLDFENSILDKPKRPESCTPVPVPLPVSAPSAAASVPPSVSALVAKTAVHPPGRRITRLPTAPAGLNHGPQKGQRRTLQALGVYNTQLDNVPDLVSLDFWEVYDPDEVCNTGFGLIGFDPFYSKPVCFLCGSAGKKKLIHCASCCEPYHQFCVEMGILGGPLPPARFANEEWRVDWVCPRCTVCHGCGRSTIELLTSCQRCYHSYHLNCLGTTALRKNGGNHLWICSSCLHCKSCNSPEVTKFVGNLPFCKPCFRLRQKGNFCPLCQGCYTDDDFQSKMMECAECKSWVHAKCEGLSDEKYQILSYLPESVEFICRLCCTMPPAPWWLAVEAELQAGYINIIKAITKNRKACAMLKWSPKKSCNCRQSIHNAAALLGRRRLSFNTKFQICEAQVPACSVTSSASSNPSVFEFDDDTDAGENAPITKFRSKDKNKMNGVGVDIDDLKVECGIDNTESQFSPHAGSQSDSGIGSTDDELKASSAAEEEEAEDSKMTLELLPDECCCTPRELRNSSPSLMSVKKKVHMSEYSSIVEFHHDMDLLISEADSEEVKELYHQTLQEVFPWFDPKYTRVNRSRKESYSLSPCKPHHGSLLECSLGSNSPDKRSLHVSSANILKRLIPVDLEGMGDRYYYSGMCLEDTRICSFCKLVGDSASYDEGRLLYCGQNEWVHVNCALWSAEVYEEIDGALQNVNNAMSRGRLIRCPHCGKKGASVGCCAKKCEETMHFPCARKVGFVFMEDKNVFCPLHRNEAPGKPLTKDSDFDISRPVFVELDRRKRKSVESRQVRLMIGSLMIHSLGKIDAVVSDHGAFIIPTEFECTRLYWSSKEPWRIVQYTIRTSIRIPVPEPTLDTGVHITVDHSKEAAGIEPVSQFNERQVSEVNGETTAMEREPLPVAAESQLSLGGEDSVVRAVLNQVLDVVCNREADEEVSDPQNPADLLPPEIKDAIFEDLPHDLLDGISMQDIFQDKFLNFEELGKEETTEDSPECESGQNAADSRGQDHKDESSCDKSKVLKTSRAARELKRSKSDVLPSHASHIASRLHQRSCSLAWSCKLGTSISCCKGSRVAAGESGMDRTQLIQELRLSVKPASSVDLKYHLQGTNYKDKENHSLSWQRMMQVDGMLDSCSSGSDSGSDMEMSNSNSKALTCKYVQCKRITFTADNKDNVFDKNSVTKHGCVYSGKAHRKTHMPLSDHHAHKWRKARSKVNSSESSYLCQISGRLKLPQVDGATDFSSDSDHDTASSTHYNPQGDEKPVRCNRCHCTYRTEESYARHLPNCSGDYSLTTSESEAEMSEDEASCTKRLLPGIDHPAPSPDSAISSISSGSLCGAPSISPSLPDVANVTPTTLVATTTVHCVNRNVQSKPSSASQHSSVLQAPGPQEYVRSEKPSSTPLASASVKVARVVAMSKPKSSQVNSQQVALKMVLVGDRSEIQQLQQTQPQHYHHQSQQQLMHQTLQQSVHQTIQQSTQPQSQQVITMLDYPQQQQSGPTGPTVLVQSVPSAAMVPAYLEAFQQHTGQNLQYLATVDTNNAFGKTQYVTAVPSSVVPGTFQLQALPDGQLCLEPSSIGLPTVPSLQLTQPQPQMLGTLIQSPLPCGVVTTTEPMYETLQMYPDQSGGVLLTSQPMLTCMETVVSNTYMQMSSSQFVSSTVPGMLQGSSTFSRTTTQVFQASKMDSPVMDMQTQYIVVNPHSNLADQGLSKMDVVSLPQPQVKEQIPIQSINLPVPSTTLPAPIPPQTLPPVIPTSIVTPMPRVQPQRTYSKPPKGGKDLIGAMSSILTGDNSVALTRPAAKNSQCSTLNASVSVSTTSSRSEAPDLGAVSMSLAQMKNSPGNWLQEAVQTSEKCILSQPELLVNTAPAQSITLPDPIADKIPNDSSASICGKKNFTTSASSGHGKCPPVTFSYRAQIMAKAQQKSSSQQTVRMPTPKTTSVSVKSSTPHVVASKGQPLFLVSSTASVTPACLSVVTKGIPSSSPVVTSSKMLLSSSSVKMQGSKTSSATVFSCGNRSTAVPCTKPVATIVPSAQAPLSCVSSNDQLKSHCESVSAIAAPSSSKGFNTGVPTTTYTGAAASVMTSISPIMSTVTANSVEARSVSALTVVPTSVSSILSSMPASAASCVFDASAARTCSAFETSTSSASIIGACSNTVCASTSATSRLSASVKTSIPLTVLTSAPVKAPLSAPACVTTATSPSTLPSISTLNCGHNLQLGSGTLTNTISSDSADVCSSSISCLPSSAVGESSHVPRKKNDGVPSFLTTDKSNSISTCIKSSEQTNILIQPCATGTTAPVSVPPVTSIVRALPPSSRMLPKLCNTQTNTKLVQKMSTISASNQSINDSCSKQGMQVYGYSEFSQDTKDPCATPVAFTAATTTTTTSILKPVSSAITGGKPLQEINHTSLNVDLKTAAGRLPSSGQNSSVPPTVLKSSTLNVDTSRKPGDPPILFSTGDKSPTSLKLLFQKQAHSGCYKVSSTPGKPDEELVAVKLADISIIQACLKDKKQSKEGQIVPDGSENVKPLDKNAKKGQQNMSPEIVYEIHCQDGFSYTSTSISEAWQKVFGAVQEARANHKMPPLLHNPFSTPETAPNVLGLSNNNIKYLLEQLPGVGNCNKYRPVYHKSRLPEPGDHHSKDDCETLPKENRSGCARTDPFLSAKKYDMFSWLDSRHRCPPKLLEINDIDSLCGSRRATSVNLPMAMRFRHLRETSKTSVGVFRSDIHGRGLFCLRDIEAGEMVIEYAGEVIRNTLTDNRERYYQSKGIGCYMFKVDDNFTVDATRRGNAARFINHSCEPNCYSRVVDILGKKHIIIFAFRRIPQGEELTYDYKFPIEDEKIHCHCLARRCRKYLN